nr:unnamed protein product [Callosobruchus analis]
MFSAGFSATSSDESAGEMDRMAWKKNTRKRARLHGERKRKNDGEESYRAGLHVIMFHLQEEVHVQYYKSNRKGIHLTQFYQRGCKDEQDTYLLGLMECRAVARRCLSEEDLLGKHNNRPHNLSPEIMAKIICHLESFPTKVSYYRAKEAFYHDAILNVKTMYDLFIKKYSEEKETVKYEFYMKVFKENSKFGTP